jgi:ATP synthase A1 C subunit
MTDFDYGNARLRAMKSRLLSTPDYEELSQSGNVMNLISTLTQTPYRKSIDAALARTSGMDCINLALRENLVELLQKIRHFYVEKSAKKIEIILRAYDVHNLKAILRGLGKNIPSDEILAVLLPVGDIPYDVLIALIRESSPRDLIDLLASWSLPIAQPLLKLRSEYPGADVFEMELALEQWYFEVSFRQLQEESDLDDVLISVLKLDADLINLLSILRLVHNPVERNLLRERLRTNRFKRIFVGPGFLTLAALEQLGAMNSFDEVVTGLKSTIYEPALRMGLEKFKHSGRLSDFETHLKKFRMRWKVQWINKDPLGIGVFIGYLALKMNEINNLRWITQGIGMGLRPEAIWAELELVG